MSKEVEANSIMRETDDTATAAYFVTAAELYLLLFSLKLPSLPMPEGILDHAPDDGESALAALSLVKKGILSPDDDRHLVLNDSVRLFLQTVKNYTHVVFERGYPAEVEPKCLYFQDGLVAECKPDRAKGGSFSIRCLKTEELAKETAAYECLQMGEEQAVSTDGTKETADSAEESLPAPGTDAKTLLTDARVILLEERFERSTPVRRLDTLLICRTREGLSLVSDTESGRKTADFSPEDLFSTVYRFS